jgi:propionyl-CoA synthetase
MDACTSRYHEVYARATRDPDGFWGDAAAEIDWYEPAKRIFDSSAGVYGRWFVGASCNTCFNALDRHVMRGRANQPALIHDSPMTGARTVFTYAQLLTEVKTLAAILQDFGVTKGDRVVLYMPAIPEAVIGMLACARIGAVHSVVFGGFAPKELASRIDDAKPMLILSASCGLEPGRTVKYKPLLDEAIALSLWKPPTCLILQRPQEQAPLEEGRDHDWGELRTAAVAANKAADCVPVAARSTSSTPPEPPGCPRASCATTAAIWSRSNGR